MTKILYVCPSSGIGGAETFLKQTFTHRNSEQYENHYLVFKSGPLSDELKKQGASVYLLPTQPRLSKWSDHKQVQQKLKQLINDLNIDLVHSTMAYGALFSAWTCKQMRVPHIWFQHGPASGWMDRMAAVLPHQGLVVNSHYTGQAQRRLENPLRFLIPRKIPIEKILLGTTDKEWSPNEISKKKTEIVSEHNIVNNDIIIAMLCRLQSWKGVHVLLDALSLLQREETNEAYHLVIWGEAFKGTDYLNSLKKKVANERLPVTFAGNTNSPSLSLAASDIIVNASTQPEPFGLSIIEGMMVGAVPIVPDEGGPMEIIQKGHDGLIFKAREARSLAQQLKTLINSKELRQKLSTHAQQSAQQKYTAARAIHQLEQFYEKFSS